MTFIYALCEPDAAGAIRYIGKTADLDKRYREHVRAHQPWLPKYRWISKLQARGLSPQLEVLQVCESDWPEQEREWINFGRANGWRLLNTTPGGDHVREAQSIIGQQFGQLTVLAHVFGTGSLVECLCSCGTKTVKTVKLLRSNQTRSCGCRRRALKGPRDARNKHVFIEGQRFGQLRTLKLRLDISRQKKAQHAECECDCGNRRIVALFNLHSGNSTSCGCARRGKRPFKRCKREIS